MKDTQPVLPFMEDRQSRMQDYMHIREGFNQHKTRNRFKTIKICFSFSELTVTALVFTSVPAAPMQGRDLLL